MYALRFPGLGQPSLYLFVNEVIQELFDLGRQFACGGGARVTASVQVPMRPAPMFPPVEPTTAAPGVLRKIFASATQLILREARHRSRIGQEPLRHDVHRAAQVHFMIHAERFPLLFQAQHPRRVHQVLWRAARRRQR